MNVDDVVSEVFRLYEYVGLSQYLGEDVTNTEHAIQCGMLAETEGHSKQVILSAFLHDIGHLVGIDKNFPQMVTDGCNIGTRDHDIVGAEYLEKLGFPKLICDAVGGHVQAKRYLVYKNQDYYDLLTDASKKTLVHQGGMMTSSEADAFEKSEAFDIILKLRSWDERAKDTTSKMDQLTKFRNMCSEMLSSNLLAMTDM